MEKNKFNIIFIERLESTNNYATLLVRDHRPEEGTVIWTAHQTHGKGYAKNTWESEVGKNLTFSLILYPTFIKPDDEYYISKLISLGITDVLKKYAEHIAIKWPNDIYFKNLKIGGILIENQIKHDVLTSSVAGIGLNINQERFLSNAPNPVSLFNITEKTYDLEKLLHETTDSIMVRYDELKSGRSDIINHDYINRLYRYNQRCFFESNDREFAATILGVENNGKIVLQTEDGKLKKYEFKQVEFKR